jgi:hypothetical protein
MVYPDKLHISERLKTLLKSMSDDVADRILYFENFENAPQWINYLDIATEDCLKISYLDKSRYKTCVDSNIDYFNSNYRYMSSPGRLLNKLGIEFNGQEVSNFFDKYKALMVNERIDNSYNLKFVSEDEIYFWYDEENYFDTTGSLGSSCMRYSKCSDWLSLYVLNHDVVKMFIVTKEHRDYNYVTNEYEEEGIQKLVGRCLIWEDKYFDRIYGTNSVLEVQMQMYLEKLGYIDAYNHGSDISIDLKYGYNSFDEFPYCDTFKYLSNNRISNVEFKSYILKLDCAEGNYQGECEICYISGRSYRTDQMRYINYLDSYVEEDYAVYSNVNNEYILKDDSLQTYLGDSILIEESVLLENGQYAHMDDEDIVKLENNRYVFKKDCEYIFEDEKWQLKES